MTLKAIYCRECEHYVGWWRQAGSKFTIAGVISVISIVTLAWTAIDNKLILPYSNVYAYSPSCSRSSADVYFTNTGNRPAIIDDGKIKRTFDGNTDGGEKALAVARESALLKAGETRLVKFEYMEEDTPSEFAKMFPNHKCEYGMTLMVTHYDSKDTEEPKQISKVCACTPSD